MSYNTEGPKNQTNKPNHCIAVHKIKEGIITGLNSHGPHKNPLPERKWNDPDVYIRYIYATKLRPE
jgi:hypothetical protein